MPALALTQTSDCSNPVLDVYTQKEGQLVDVDQLQFQIWQQLDTPVQVYPSTPGNRADVDLDPCPAGDRLSLGRYVARYVVPNTLTAGNYEIRWFYKWTPTSAERTFVETFQITAAPTAPTRTPLYVSLQDLRDEGVPNTVTDGYLLKRIQLAQMFVEATTRRFFYPKEMTVRLNGTGGPKLFLFDPIIAIEYVKFEISPLYPDDFSIIETDIQRIYNRHIYANLTEPDDRNNPHIELFNPGFVRDHGRWSLLTRLNFPVGQQNVEIKGVFGYTEPDGSSTGGVPPLINHVTKLLVFRELAKMSSGNRGDAMNRWRLQSESTRDQSYTMEGLGALKLVPGNGFTGDPEIDNILSYYMRPPMMGAA